MKRYVVQVDEVETYSPPKHVGTVNRRLLGKGVLGAENFEVVMGVVQKGGEAEEHSHAGSEQAIFILEGLGRLEIEDQQQEVGPNTMIHLPKNVPHRLVTISDTPLKCLVMYSPPLADW
ncbi:MAG: cupin domain-containing protein [Chloroflexi bacterium]|nr:cupin domain-containing protein [Chloroflexota bacterium]